MRVFKPKADEYYCDLGDECGGRTFLRGEIVNYNQDEDNFFCNDCAKSLERKYHMKFESRVIQYDDENEY